MRNAMRLIVLFVLFIAVSCSDKPIEPFELSIADHNQSLKRWVLFKLSNEKLIITFRRELENEKDSVLYSTTEFPKHKIRQLSNINIDSLNVLYASNCLEHGNIRSFRFTKNGKSIPISLENYYHYELSPVIEVINGIVPEKFIMYYDKAELIKEMESCGEFQIIKSWEEYDNEK
ncbi:hypothetical protein MWU65_17280 [Cellulophaga sp. F20128]|uniref:hypothetical protein n=1 Tax=Cellulophaga sp. F20128 TaxID=2926413 RepID=UPI001FF672F6|nr:hypothetical protein [Cellulophaga sp. F20128]MCK0158943.1 hypothetical protein [Cellulophaga sp. F20128]